MIRLFNAGVLRSICYPIPDHVPDSAVILWEPYRSRRQTNARPLVSRAKREGLYCGKHSGSVTCMITEETVSWGAKHCRQGVDQYAVPLRHRKDYVASTKEEVEAILDKIILKGTS